MFRFLLVLSGWLWFLEGINIQKCIEVFYCGFPSGTLLTFDYQLPRVMEVLGTLSNGSVPVKIAVWNWSSGIFRYFHLNADKKEKG